MSRKRTLIPDFYKQKKRRCLTQSARTNGFTKDDEDELKAIGNDTKATMIYLRNLFPVEKFEHRLPPIIMRHQLYSILKDQTAVDKHIEELQEAGDIKAFYQSQDVADSILVFTDDYRCHVQCVMTEVNVAKEIIEKFVKTVINECTDMCMGRDQLTKAFAFTDSEIKQLERASVLRIHETDKWWLALPNASIFTKCFLRGRKAVITMIKKCKYREVLRNDLEQRKWPKIAKLGLLYHIHDIIGARLVECTDTPSGQLLRLKE